LPQWSAVWSASAGVIEKAAAAIVSLIRVFIRASIFGIGTNDSGRRAVSGIDGGQMPGA
jgi:hypothetical protein